MPVKLSSPADAAIIERIKEAVGAIEPRARAILYGSRARGDAQPDSDWDLLLITPGALGKERADALDERLLQILYETGAVVSPFAVSEEEWRSPCSRVSPLHRNIEQDGVQLVGPAPEYEPLSEEVMEEARGQLAQQWLGEAWEALADAEHAARGERWNNSVSRLYYACFYAASALLLERGFNFAKHASVHGLFNREYGAVDAFPQELLDLYNTLFKARLEADYAPTVHFDAETVQPWLRLTRRFVEQAEALLPPGG